MSEDLVEAAFLLGLDVTAETWTVKYTDVATFLDRLGVTPPDLESLVSVLAVEQLGELPYEIRVGEWQIDLRAAVARSLLNGVTLTSVLAATHQTSIPATVISTVVPLLFDLERVQLSPGDKYIYAVLLNAPANSMNVEQWYAHLPVSVRAELTEREFRDVMGRLEDAGAVDTDDVGTSTANIPSLRRLVRLALPAAPPQQDYP